MHLHNVHCFWARLLTGAYAMIVHLHLSSALLPPPAVAAVRLRCNCHQRVCLALVSAMLLPRQACDTAHLNNCHHSTTMTQLAKQCKHPAPQCMPSTAQAQQCQAGTVNTQQRLRSRLLCSVHDRKRNQSRPITGSLSNHLICQPSTAFGKFNMLYSPRWYNRSPCSYA